MNEKDLKPRTGDGDRKKRKTKKQRKTGAKRLLIVLGTLIILAAALLISAKIAWPDVDLLFFLPETAHQLVHEELLSNTTTTTTEPVIETTTLPTTTKPAGHYAPIEEFAFEQSKKGNLMGNLLQGGKAWHDNDYIYHIVDCDGIYRFYPGSETFYRLYASPDYLANLNVGEEYLYFTNQTDKKLYSVKKKDGKELTPLADNVKTAYLYDGIIYYITYSNLVCWLDTADGSSVTLYSSSSDEVRLVGISLTRVYFTATDSFGTCRFWTVDNEGEEKPVMFREVANQKELVAPVLEDGFLYYYTPNGDGSFDLQRQKFGSENTVTLVEGAAVASYAIVDLNSLFYAHRDGDTFIAKELNMNTGEKVVRLKANQVTDDNELMYQHGGSYDFIIGYRNPKSWIYYGSCSQTSSNLIMYFSDGKWAY